MSLSFNFAFILKRRASSNALSKCFQLANLVLQDCVERFYVNETFADVDHPVFLVRGESVVLIGEIDDENIEQKPLKKAPASKVLPLVDEQLRQRKHDELQQTVAQARRGLCRTVVDMADFY